MKGILTCTHLLKSFHFNFNFHSFFELYIYDNLTNLGLVLDLCLYYVDLVLFVDLWTANEVKVLDGVRIIL